MKINSKCIKLNTFNYDQIRVGDTFSFTRFIDEAAVRSFADLTADYSPIHMDDEYAVKTEFGGRIVHGMLAGSLFSTLVGMLCPGRQSLYLSQSIQFKRPIRPDAELEIKGTVLSKSDSGKMIELKTVIMDSENNVVIDGIAKVKVREV